MFNVKEIKTAIRQIADTRQLSEEVLWSVIESALAAAYKREYGKGNQIIRVHINKDSGEFKVFQVKHVLDKDGVLAEGESLKDETDARVHFNPERHIMVQDAQLVRQGVKAGEDIMFPLQVKTDFGRIAAQSARQAVKQKIHEAERDAVINEFEGKEHTLMHGRIQRIERGNVYINLGRTIAVMPFVEKIQGERFRQGELIRVYVQSIDTKKRNAGFVRVSRACPEFIVKLFEAESPELADGTLKVKSVAREAGVRTKIAVESSNPSIDPVGSLVGQYGMRVMTVRGEIGAEQIDIINWMSDVSDFVTEALLPAEILDAYIDEETGFSVARVPDNQVPVAIGRGGQNLRLAAKVVGRVIVLVDSDDNEVARGNPDGTVEVSDQKIAQKEPLKKDEGEETKESGNKGEEGAGGPDEAPVKDDVEDTPAEKPEEVKEETDK